ncbi:MAG: MoaD/ThiS family protein [Actinomycetota bacterium]|nr:MoaD/ThiS family protein [Actinomycetota bacterium]
MAVRVRMFAALREAAGRGETRVEPGRLPAVLDDLRARYGEPFTARLALCSVLLDGSTVQPDGDVEVVDGAELALLPPVSGGSGSTRP